VVGFDSREPDFFWLAGQGDSGIPTSPALSAWAAGVFLDGLPPRELVELGLEAGYFSPSRLISQKRTGDTRANTCAAPGRRL